MLNERKLLEHQSDKVISLNLQKEDMNLKYMKREEKLTIFTSYTFCFSLIACDLVWLCLGCGWLLGRLFLSFLWLQIRNGGFACKDACVKEEMHLSV